MAVVKGFIGQSYMSSAKRLSSQECLNLYPEMDKIGGKSAGMLIGTPGLESFCSANGSGSIRGLYTSSTNKIYTVRGSSLSLLDASGSSTLIDTLDTSTGNVAFADNGTQLMIVDGYHGYIVDMGSNAFSVISDSAFPTATTVCFMDGYFIVNKEGTGQFHWSDSYDGLHWDSGSSLHYATAEGTPDNLVGVVSTGDVLWLMGTQSLEAWYGEGSSSLPFSLISGTHSDIGCEAVYSMATYDRTLFWLGGSKIGKGVVYMSEGYLAKPISTLAIENSISEMSDISDAVGFTYHQNGHAFYVLSFPTGNQTWVYDLSTGMWHRRGYLDNTKSDIQRWWAGFYTYSEGIHYIGDYRNGSLYKLKLDVYEDNGDPIKRVRSTPHISNENKLIRFDRFELEYETSTANIVGAGSTPDIVLEYSNDGGNTWSSELTASMGKTGTYGYRAIWRRLGIGRDRVFRITVADEPVKIQLINAYIEYQTVG